VADPEISIALTRHRPKKQTTPPGKSQNITTPPLIRWSIQEIRLAVKSPNKTGFPVAEAMERRAGTKGNADQQSTHRTQIRARVTQALGRVRQADQRFAVKHPR
jgi:hypothetical protein